MTVLDNLKRRFTTPYHTEDGGNIDKLMQVVATPITELSDTTDDIVSAHQLSEATGYSLDQWGNLLQVLRTTGETDDHYRARLTTQLLIYRRSATVQDMVASCANVLGVATDRVSLTDGTSPASFSMKAFLSDIVAAGLSLSEYGDIMSSAKAGGVAMTLTAEGSFECKSVAAGSDLTKAYNNIANANPTGGRYSGLIGVI
jgi:hypothetical protein